MGINDILQIGNNIKKYRKGLNITQEEMAIKINIPRSTYANYENNQRTPNAVILLKIADALDVNVNDLLGITEVKFSPLEIKIQANPLDISIEPLSNEDMLAKKDFFQEISEIITDASETDKELIYEFSKLEPLERKVVMNFIKTFKGV